MIGVIIVLWVNGLITQHMWLLLEGWQHNISTFYYGFYVRGHRSWDDISIFVMGSMRNLESVVWPLFERQLMIRWYFGCGKDSLQTCSDMNNWCVIVCKQLSAGNNGEFEGRWMGHNTSNSYQPIHHTTVYNIKTWSTVKMIKVNSFEVNGVACR